MESLVGKKAIYKSPYTGIEVEFEIVYEIKNAYFGDTPYSVISKNGSRYPICQIKTLNDK